MHKAEHPAHWRGLLQADTSSIVGEPRGLTGIMLDDIYRIEHSVVQWLGVRSSLGEGWKPRDTAGIWQLFSSLFVGPPRALKFCSVNEPGLGVLRMLLRHTVSISFANPMD